MFFSTARCLFLSRGGPRGRQAYRSLGTCSGHRAALRSRPAAP